MHENRFRSLQRTEHYLGLRQSAGESDARKCGLMQQNRQLTGVNPWSHPDAGPLTALATTWGFPSSLLFLCLPQGLTCYGAVEKPVVGEMEGLSMHVCGRAAA